MENLNIKIFEDVGEASDFFEKELSSLPYLTDVVDAYKNIFGGCSCNRSRRINYANEMYKATINQLSEDEVKIIKDKLKVDKIVFKIESNQIIKEF